MLHLRYELTLYLFVVFLLMAHLLAPKNSWGQLEATYPPLTNDSLNLYIGALSDQEKLERDILIAELNQFRERTNRKFVVVIIRSLYDYPGTANGSMKDFANALFDASGLAQQTKDYDDNILLLIASKTGETYLKIGSAYLESTQANAMQVNTEVIAPAVKNGQIFEAITTSIPRVRQALFGYLFEPMPFPWHYVYTPLGVVGILTALILLTQRLLQLTWQSATIFVFGGVFVVLFYLITPSPQNRMYDYTPGGPVARLLEEFSRRKKKKKDH